MKHYIGIDVGTGSARAGIFNETGTLLGVAKHNIAMTRPQPTWAEQSTSDIWHAIAIAIKGALQQSGLSGADINAVGFDATCSLALADKDFQPLSIAEDNNVRDVIVWMDQRAVAEAKACCETGAEPLDYVGGTMSPEMQMPKLLWLKRHRPELWTQLGYAGDLSDWLTRKATGSNARSVCTLTCKWGFMPHKSPSWDSDFLAQLDLSDVRERANLPDTAMPVGSSIGTLTAQAAEDLGLTTDCVVSAGMIDAHAAAVLSFSLLRPDAIPETLGLVAGTSNCHMAMHTDSLLVPGVWGPYHGVVHPNYWLNEGGQTTTGALLEHLIQSYRGADEFLPDIHANVSKALLEFYQKGVDPAPETDILPDFLGNRSPHADPNLRGVISGLSFTTTKETFAHTYWAAACAIAYGTRAIIERMQDNGYQFKRIVLTGGHAKSPLLTRLYADTTGCDLLLPQTDEPVLLGSAMTACASAHGGDLSEAMKLAPAVEHFAYESDKKALHDKRYERFEKLYRHYKDLFKE